MEFHYIKSISRRESSLLNMGACIDWVTKKTCNPFTTLGGLHVSSWLTWLTWLTCYMTFTLAPLMPHVAQLMINNVRLYPKLCVPYVVKLPSKTGSCNMEECAKNFAHVI